MALAAPAVANPLRTPALLSTPGVPVTCIIRWGGGGSRSGAAGVRVWMIIDGGPYDSCTNHGIPDTHPKAFERYNYDLLNNSCYYNCGDLAVGQTCSLTITPMPADNQPHAVFCAFLTSNADQNELQATLIVGTPATGVIATLLRQEG